MGSRICRALIFATLIALPAAAQNILPNPGFETWLDTIGINLPLGWVTSEITRPGSATKSDESHTGDFAVQLTSPDTSAFITTTTLIGSGRSYDFAAWARTPSVLGGSFVITWLGLLGTPLGTPSIIPVYLSSGYREYSRRITAPDSAYFCLVAFATTPTATVYVDDVTLDTLASSVRAGAQPVTNRFYLYPAQPNPFPSYTIISYSMSVGNVASLRVYDLVGNEVRTIFDEYKPAGFYNSYWDATDNAGDYVAPGIYFCRLEVGTQTLTEKLMLVGE